MEDPDDVVAHHEAGHASASWFLRGHVGTITIEPTERHAGGTEVWVLPRPLIDEFGKIVEKDAWTTAEVRCFEDAVMITMAGPVAETIYWPHRDYEDVLSRNQNDEGKVVTITRKVWPSKADEVEAELHARVRGLLEKRWERLDRLARILEEKRTLDGAAVAEILGHWSPD